MRCKIVSYSVPDNPQLSTSNYHVESRCETHFWHGGPIINDLCPIGRIEDATNKAIERIIGMNDAIHHTPDK